MVELGEGVFGAVGNLLSDAKEPRCIDAGDLAMSAPGRLLQRDQDLGLMVMEVTALFRDEGSRNRRLRRGDRGRRMAAHLYRYVLRVNTD